VVNQKKKRFVLSCARAPLADSVISTTHRTVRARQRTALIGCARLAAARYWIDGDRWSGVECNASAHDKNVLMLGLGHCCSVSDRFFGCTSAPKPQVFDSI
jgi:hypothetical protein